MHFILLLLLLPASAHASFVDVSEGYSYREAVEYVEDAGIVEGYPDGSYRPDSTINRAEFTKILIASRFDTDETDGCRETEFTDVPKESWFVPYVCVAKRHQIIDGYPDGTFRPAATINVAEAAKILVNVYGLQSGSGSQWYEPFIRALGEQKALPLSILKIDSLLTRGEMAEMVWRLREEITDRPFHTAEALLSPPACQEFDPVAPTGVDMSMIRTEWLSWINAERSALGLPSYTYNPQLDRTAYLWSQYSAEQGVMAHKRPGQTTYYDYPLIAQWFKDLGLVFKNIDRVTFSENIGAGPYFCSKPDCTQDFLESIRYTFDFYLAEKGKDDQPHYGSLTNTYFTQIGFGVAVSPDGTKYYITTHYGTEIASQPLPICE